MLTSHFLKLQILSASHLMSKSSENYTKRYRKLMKYPLSSFLLGILFSCSNPTRETIKTIEGIPVKVSQDVGDYKIELLQLTDPYDLRNYQEIKISYKEKVVFQETDKFYEIHGKQDSIVRIKNRSNGNVTLYFEFNQRPDPSNYLPLNLNGESVKKLDFQESITLK